MLNSFLTGIAVAYLAIAGISVLVGPFLIGKERGKFTGWTYLSMLYMGFVYTVVAGRLLSWW